MIETRESKEWGKLKISEMHSEIVNRYCCFSTKRLANKYS